MENPEKTLQNVACLSSIIDTKDPTQTPIAHSLM
jgi:hypothetical protein